MKTESFQRLLDGTSIDFLQESRKSFHWQDFRINTEQRDYACYKIIVEMNTPGRGKTQ